MKEDNLSRGDNRAVPNASLVRRFYCSKTSISGPSEERTPPLERTDQLPPIEHKTSESGRLRTPYSYNPYKFTSESGQVPE